MRLLWLALAAAPALPALAAPAASAPVAAEQPPPYTDTTSAVALRNLRQIGSRDPAHLSDAEAAEWVRARFAWVALLRLQGKNSEALEVFEGCRAYCAKLGPSGEWAALKAWGCGRAPKAEACK